MTARWPVQECVHENTDRVMGYVDGVVQCIQEICIDCDGTVQPDGTWAP